MQRGMTSEKAAERRRDGGIKGWVMLDLFPSSIYSIELLSILPLSKQLSIITRWGICISPGHLKQTVMALSVAEGTPIKASSFPLPETRSFINLSSDTFTGSGLIKGTWDPCSTLTIKHFYNRHSLEVHIKFHFRPSEGKRVDAAGQSIFQLVFLKPICCLPATSFVSQRLWSCVHEWALRSLEGKRFSSHQWHGDVSVIWLLFLCHRCIHQTGCSFSHTYHNDERARAEALPRLLLLCHLQRVASYPSTFKTRYGTKNIPPAVQHDKMSVERSFSTNRANGVTLTMLNVYHRLAW